MGLEKINYLGKQKTIRESKVLEVVLAEKKSNITDKLLGLGRRKG